MNLVEKEIRDYLQANLNTSNTAAVGTTTTNITINNHGLNVGDNIINTTRSSGNVAVSTIVDTNNFTVPAITGQTNGDTIQFVPFKRYYIGKIPNDALPVNYLPCLVIHGYKSSIFKRHNQADAYAYDLKIEAYTDAFDFVANADLTNDVLAAQLDLRKKMAGRDSTTYKLLLTSVLGCLTDTLKVPAKQWNSFLFFPAQSFNIDYDSGVLKGKYYYKAVLSLRVITSLTLWP